ncbi:MAG: efflux RND transporter periplasmic adaptor subunit [Tabrizicola sp.]|nr:efflux RND transporter periplasmic adaptor subunit [Tabrizicola sp.]
MTIDAPRPASVTRRIGRVFLTLAVFGLCFAAVVGGRSLITQSNAMAPDSPAPLVPVSAMTVQLMENYSVTRRFTGQIEAEAQGELGFEFGGRIAEVTVDEGDRVAAGTVLARLDTASLIPERAALEAELEALSADAELARLTLARNDALTERGVRSVAAQDEARLALARSDASMAAIRARIAGVDVRLEKSVLVAPFDARIGVRLVDSGQTVAAGQAGLVVFQDTAPRLRVGLPPDLAESLRVGDSVTVELGGQAQSAKIMAMRPDLDPGIRSLSVILSLPDGASEVLGETAVLILESTVAERGYWAPLSALREGVRGSWAVMALEPTAEGERTVLAAVEVIHTDGTMVFLRGGLPEGARIVRTAPDRVAPGQRVAALVE